MHEHRDPTLRHVLGLDLGRQTDPSALALLQWRNATVQSPKRAPSPDQEAALRGARLLAGEPEPPPPTVSSPVEPTVYGIPTLRRWPLGTAYRVIAQDVTRFLGVLPATTSPPIVVCDATGVGLPITEMIGEEFVAQQVFVGLVAVVITCGSAVTAVQSGQWRVAKKVLVSTMQVLMGNRRLHVARDQPDAEVLVAELGVFQEKITANANETFESWREKDHDDLVLAVALAAWYAEMCGSQVVSWVETPPRGDGTSQLFGGARTPQGQSSAERRGLFGMGRR